MNYFKPFILSLIFWSFGVYVGVYKIFPFKQIKYIQDFLEKSPKNQPFSKEDRFKKTKSKINVNINKAISTGVFITYGQSNSLSSGQKGYIVKHPVYQFFNDSCFIYTDPVLGTDDFSDIDNYGSVWGLVGDRLVEKGHYNQVIFSVCGWGGATMNQLSGGELFNYLIDSYNNLKNHFGKVDGILFHQGESNHTLSKEGNDDYYEIFNEFWEKINRNDSETRIFLSQASYCNNYVDKNLVDIQDKIIIDLKRVLRGPNTDTLIDSKYRLPDGCHFSMEGFKAYSNIWAESVIKQSEI